ncbi:hypothetical protein Y032_0011g1276 [Ancylostoma ceylanicum]|uniref:Uncharacterized protein n=1 Tax=Ancylostoma ceylanicum TaxID=53326 RepID=A0A016VD74_9BILA|nr:hypothetical protein Y032_0011g1276 [Ancylostoma ceylanicum]
MSSEADRIRSDDLDQIALGRILKKWAESKISDKRIYDCVLEYLKNAPDLEHPETTTEASTTETSVPPVLVFSVFNFKVQE